MIGKARTGIVSVLVVLVVAMMIVPLPPAMLDILIAANFSISIAILLLTMYTKEPLEFSVFPSLLLIMTLFRLAINVSSTRLILLQYNAGRIIEAFGQFVVGGNEIVGLVVFLILVIIQFVVITRGSERVAESWLPGSPWTPCRASRCQSTQIQRRPHNRGRGQGTPARRGTGSGFHGAMDGAAKFVKGDAMRCAHNHCGQPVGRFEWACCNTGYPPEKRGTDMRCLL